MLLIIDEFDKIFSNKEKFFLNGIDINLGKDLSKYIIDKSSELETYLEKVIKVYNSKKKKKDQILNIYLLRK